MPAGFFAVILATKMRDFPYSLSLPRFPTRQIHGNKCFQKHIFWSQISLPQMPNSYYLKLITWSVLLLFLAWCSGVMRSPYIPGSLGESGPSFVKSSNLGALSGNLLPCHIPRAAGLQKYSCNNSTDPSCSRNDSPWHWLFPHCSGCVWQLGLLWCDGLTTLFNRKQIAWGNGLSSSPTSSLLHPCSLSTLTKHASVECFCMDAHIAGMPPSSCWHSTDAVADGCLS